MDILSDRIVKRKSNKFLEIKREIKKALKVFLLNKQCSKLFIFFCRIRQLLGPEERKYFKNKYLSKYFNLPTDSKAKVIILGLRTFSTHNLSVFEKVLSDFLRNNGAFVKILICDNILDSCDAEIEGDLLQEVICYRCKKERKQYKKLYRNEYISFSQFISPEEIEHAKNLVSSLGDKDLTNFTYMGVNITRHAIDSTIKYFRKGNFNPNNPSHLKILRHNILQGVISLIVANNVVKQEKPTHFITLHGCYVSWGPFYEFCRKNKIYAVAYGKAVHRIGSFMFTSRERNTKKYYEIIWNEFKEKKLSETQKKELKEFLYLKKRGKTLDYQLYSQGKKTFHNDSNIQKILNSTKVKKYVLCPNLLWDMGLESRGSNLFNDIYDWMYKTIEYFSKMKKYYLLVKPHPGEASIDRTEKGVNDVIIEHFGKLPENIILLPKEYPITSFDLMEKDCIGITYNGTVGMEYSYFKKPILVAGNIHYLDFGVALKVKSLEEYFNCIKDPTSLYEYPQQNYDLIEKYTYFYYFKLIIPILFFRKDKWLGHCIDWSKLSDYENFIKKDRIMNYIADSIIKKQVIVCPDDVSF